MKVLRIVLISVFLLSVFATGAQASDRVTGFVPLVSSVDPNTPIEFQTRNALNAIMPDLLNARHEGLIYSFRANLQTGVLVLSYPASAAGSLSLAGRPVYQSLADARAAIAAPQAARTERVAPAVGAELIPTFTTWLYSNCFSATDLPGSAAITASLRDATGWAVAVYQGTVNSLGQLSGCFNEDNSYPRVTPGYTLKFVVNNDPGQTYSVVVPSIRFTGIDKLNSLVRGTGTKNLSFIATWYQQQWTLTTPTEHNATVTGTISSTGAWVANFDTAGIAFRGNDRLGITVTAGTYFRFQYQMFVPYVSCGLRTNYCASYGFPFAKTYIQVTRGTAIYTFSGRADSKGFFWIDWRNAVGAPVFLKSGDILTAPGVKAFALPAMSANVNLTDSLVTGKAPKNKNFYVFATLANQGSQHQVYTHSNTLGNYTSDFGAIGLTLVSPLTVQVSYITPGGNEVDYFKRVGP